MNRKDFLKTLTAATALSVIPVAYSTERSLGYFFEAYVLDKDNVHGRIDINSLDIEIKKALKLYTRNQGPFEMYSFYEESGKVTEVFVRGMGRGALCVEYYHEYYKGRITYSGARMNSYVIRQQRVFHPHFI